MGRTRNNRRRSVGAVINEQQRQRDMLLLDGEEADPEMLAEIYKGYTNQCALQAQRKGSMDQEVARSIAAEREVDEEVPACVSKAWEESTVATVESDALSLLDGDISSEEFEMNSICDMSVDKRNKGKGLLSRTGSLFRRRV